MKAVDRAAARVKKWIKETHGGVVLHAAADLGCEYTTLWRVANGLTARGPSNQLVAVLIERAGQTFDYWTGREA